MFIIIKFSGPEISWPWGAVLCSCLLRKAWCCHNLFIRPHNAQFRIQLTKKWAFGVIKKKKKKKERRKKEEKEEEKVDQNTKVELEKKALLNGTVEKSVRVVVH